MNIPQLEMTEATYAEFKAWWPLFVEHVPQLVTACNPVSSWDNGAGVTMDRWSQRLQRMQCDTAVIMNDLGMVPGEYLEREE